MIRVFLLVLLFPFAARSQNLVLNHSFEEENICTEYVKNCAPEGWIASSLYSNYYFLDPQTAWDGTHFAGLPFNNNPNSGSRQFIRSRLLCQLKKNVKYRLELFVRSLQPDVDSVGIYFSPNDLLYQRTGIKGITPNFWMGDGFEEGRARQSRWKRVIFTFTARGDEKYIVIGDFKKAPHHIEERRDVPENLYFFIDHVMLEMVNHNEKLCPEAEKTRKEEYSMNDRHNLLEKKIYFSQQPTQTWPPPVLVERVDTLIIPDVLFETNSYYLSKKVRRMLDQFIRKSSQVILSIDSVIVEGHTDSTGNISRNIRLSMQRARAVANYMQPYVVPNIKIRGWASRKPIADNRTPEGRQKNRRVEIYLYIRE
jgi:outer membrane protein OmpA-like peptidoglycan-associated protein